MAISWRHVRGSERPARDAYATLERELIANAAAHVKAEAASRDRFPGWWRLNNIRDKTRLLVQQLGLRAVTAARQAVTTAAKTGRQQAERDLRARHLHVAATAVDQRVAADAAREVTKAIQDTVPNAIRSGDDLYRKALLAITSQPATSEAHRLRIAQQVMNELAGHGITGFVDKAGRNWGIASYIEMATRATAFNAMVDSHTGTLSASGQDLVVISTAVACCEKCAPWEGAVLSISGMGNPGVPIKGSLADARAAGWGHPRCRCHIGLFRPGDPLPQVVPPPSPEQYAASQHLRYLERQVRALKLVKAAALDPVAEREADVRIRDCQAKIRAHIAATGAKRVRRREQIGRAL